MKVLVTGGAGFIGSHIVDALLADGHRVIVLDSLHPQVHPTRRKPAYLSPNATFVRGDVRNVRLLGDLISKVDVIYHEASLVGVGQSMYEIDAYVDINVRGTAILLHHLVNRKHRVRKLVVASSMSIYGEGAYRAGRRLVLEAVQRDPGDLRRGRYELRIRRSALKPALTPEHKSLDPTSIYAQTKRDQEEMCLLIGRTYGIPTVALRYFNVFGPRQSLDNPYTGVLAIFGTRLLNRHAPLVFEDGRQTRDFIHVRDIAAANLSALLSDRADGHALNVGSGRPRAILGVAKDLADAMGRPIQPKILKEYRTGDIRHCIADISRIRRLLGWAPRVSWAEGLTELADQIRGVKSRDRVDAALAELSKHRLRHRLGLGGRKGDREKGR
ncbi:SDR family NAD(P)-dependent oxidoreductase [bacterium]|nr:SDR family NAD(P)-dependent oxidoreductase [bacterium]